MFPLASNVITEYMEDIWLKGEFLNHLNTLISRETPIIIISEYLFKRISPILREGRYFLAQDDYIVYPDEKNIGSFRTQFLNALKNARIVII